MPTLIINNVLGVLRACQRGLGVAMLPDYLVEENGGLVQLFGEADTRRARCLSSSIRKSSNRSRASRCSATSWWRTRSAGIFRFSLRQKAARRSLRHKVPAHRQFTISTWQTCGARRCRTRCRPHTSSQLKHWMYPPRLNRCAACSPLEDVAGPHAGTLKPGPSRGPVFFGGARRRPHHDLVTLAPPSSAA